MNIDLKEVISKNDLKKFIDFQYELYKENKYWVPPLKKEELFLLSRDKNPAFEFYETKYWLAYNEDKIVGRIAGLINHKYNKKFNTKIVRFGWFDFINNNEVASTLLKAVENWGKEKGMNLVNGPLGFTDMDGEGTLIEGFDELSTIGSIYNYEYYPELIEKNGYEKDIDWVEFQVNITSDEIPDKISRIAEISLKRNNLHLLKVNKAKEFLPYAHEMFHLINMTYQELHGFIELSEKQIDMYVKQYFGFIKPEYLPVVMNDKNEMVAFGITMPSLSTAFQKANGSLLPFGFIHILKAMKNNKGLDLYLTAVRPDMQDKGVNAILMCEINKLIIKNKIKTVETNRELETNSKVQAQWRFFEHRLHKRRRCYKKNI